MTSQLIYGQSERLLPWAEARIGLGPFASDAHAIGLEREGELVAVVVFDHFSVADAHMHIASDGSRGWMSRALLIAAFAFPFIQLGLRRLTGVVPARNSVALAFDEHIGFVREGYCRHALPDDDVVILGLLREDCKWIHIKESA